MPTPQVHLVSTMHPMPDTLEAILFVSVSRLASASGRRLYLQQRSQVPRHRGRRSHNEQVEAVVPLIRADIWTLKDQHTFDDTLH